MMSADSNLLGNKDVNFIRHFDSKVIKVFIFCYKRKTKLGKNQDRQKMDWRLGFFLG